MDRYQVLFKCGGNHSRPDGHRIENDLRKTPGMIKRDRRRPHLGKRTVQSSHLAKHTQWEGRFVKSKKSQSRVEDSEDPVQEESDSKSESHVIEAFLTDGHNTKPLSCGKEGKGGAGLDPRKKWRNTQSRRLPVNVVTTTQLHQVALHLFFWSFPLLLNSCVPWRTLRTGSTFKTLMLNAWRIRREDLHMQVIPQLVLHRSHVFLPTFAVNHENPMYRFA